jgi:uncharacterized protein with HEPN domain
MWRDQAYLLDMLTAARGARDFDAGLTRDEYEASRLAQYAVAHALQIIGEAAARVSDDTRNSPLSGRRDVGARLAAAVPAAVRLSYGAVH